MERTDTFIQQFKRNSAEWAELALYVTALREDIEAALAEYAGQPPMGLLLDIKKLQLSVKNDVFCSKSNGFLYVVLSLGSPRIWTRCPTDQRLRSLFNHERIPRPSSDFETQYHLQFSVLMSDILTPATAPDEIFVCLLGRPFHLNRAQTRLPYHAFSAGRGRVEII